MKKIFLGWVGLLIMNQPAVGINPLNHLSQATSPYLLQHADQPVNWFEWGEEAFSLAKQESKPIFLSIGYSTCHWCHVMAHESFYDEQVAKLLNDHFVAIKVDREERPDIDEYYMTATQIFTNRGGWPNSLWLTHDKKPWYAGTYFPKDDRYGQPGFVSLLTELARLWKEKSELVHKQADQIHLVIESIQNKQEQAKGNEDSQANFKKVLEMYQSSFDEQHGGFSQKPKFPPHQALANLFYAVNSHENNSHFKEMIKTTLDNMAKGGIRDHLGGGFHRYSTDEKWLLPHFEKMLYDNALLLSAYAQGYQLFRDNHYKKVMEEIVNWLESDMNNGQNGYYSALDADSEGVEGKYYVWTVTEIESILGLDEANVIVNHYNVDQKGNYHDEATGSLAENNILYVKNLKSQEKLGKSKQILLEERAKRIKPHLDDKIITAWNALLISGLIQAGQAVENQSWIKKAETIGSFIFGNLYNKDHLMRSTREGKFSGTGFLNDYAYLDNALIDLFEITKNNKWLEKANEISTIMINKFYDNQDGGFYLTEIENDELPIRTKDPFDSALPAGNSMALKALIRLNQLNSNDNYGKYLDQSFNWLRPKMENQPSGFESATLAWAMMDNDRKNVDRSLLFSNKIITSSDCTITHLDRDKNIVQFSMTHLLKTGWHVTSNDNKRDDLLPYKVELENSENGKILNISYPEGNDFKSKFSDDIILVYDQEIKVSGEIQLLDSQEKEIKLKVFLQACDDSSCLAPSEMIIEVKIK